ncbi:acyltransferase [Maribellus maritimus]|uniref:acyltransferase n=1 Tax=Maribellus maritimus TaxID=2870838 RepID=UPI0021D45B02|nr:acyltransferase [Maribellus maritimus]MCG6191223.1 acyltransferase [Maribellus maritimus]
MEYSLKTIIRYGYRSAWWLLNSWRFKQLGIFAYINHPLRISDPRNIRIGRNVYVGYKTWLAAKKHTTQRSPILEIQERSSIGNFNHIYATDSIIIEKYVLTADKVYITDNLHNYADISLPIIKQPIKQLSKVVIKEGAWLGENVCVLGASIGKNCVIGANSVVTKDIPDYSVAVGAPAKIIKRFNFKTQQWEKTTPDGSFINI